MIDRSRLPAQHISTTVVSAARVEELIVENDRLSFVCAAEATLGRSPIPQ